METSSLPDIIAFVRAGGTLNFTIAARRLGVSPSAVSKAVSRLEARLGVRLLNRTSRRMALTPEGAEYHADCTRALNDLDEAERRANGLGTQPSGLLTVTMPVAIGQMHFLPSLPSFRARYPGIRLHLVLTDLVVDFIAEGIDLAIRVGNLSDSSLVCTKLFEQRMEVCASPAYLESRGTPGSVDELEEHNCLSFIRPTTGRSVPWFFKTAPDQPPRLYEPEGDLTSNNPLALRDAAVAGIGLVQLPKHVVHAEVASGRLTPVLEGCSADAPPVWAVHRQGLRPSPKIRAALDHAKSVLSFV